MKNQRTRRKLIQAGFLIPFLGTGLFSCSTKTASEPAEEKDKINPLKILILGGTSFLGPHQIAYAISRGHSISTFTRGKTKPTVHAELFNQVEQLVGDRENDLTALEKGEWDLVIDNSGRKEEWTKKTAELLKDRIGLYLYTSSTGVYYPYLGNDIKEDTQLVLEMPNEMPDEYAKYEYEYGIMKAKSEIAAKKAFGKDRSIIVRPTYMVGPADKLDRFIHWPVRLAKGGEVLVPGKANDLVQYIDVRDVAEWMIRLGEEKMAGTYSAVGPKNKQTILEFIDEAKRAFEVESTFINVDDYDFLKENKIEYIVPWIMQEGNNYGTARINNQKAIAAGLTFRNLKDTLQDTYNWWYSDSLTQARRDKFEKKPESVLMQEKEVLEKWKNFKNG